jgi:hypothetical protein
VSVPSEGGAAASTGKAPTPTPTPEPAPPARPLYGEYATVEEQRARIQQPDATWALETGQAVVAPPGDAARPEGATPRPAKVRPGPPRKGVVDRIITIGLLGYGLFAVLSSFVALTDFPAFADTWMDMVGIDGEFTNLAQGRLWGTIAAAVFAFGWLITAVLSWRMLRRGRITFWVPLVGAAVSYLAVTLLLLVPLLGDPAIAAYITSGG